MDTLKQCTKCGELKPLSEFYKNKTCKGGYDHRCKSCIKNAITKHREQEPAEVKAIQRQYYIDNKDRIAELRRAVAYGITADEYNNLFIAQNGCCAICGRHQQEFKKKLAVDHDHITGHIRALLCLNCNRGMGLLQDNSDLLRKAADYLDKFT